MLTKILAGLFVMGSIVALQVLVMTQGWGQQARSWWWIIGAGVFGQLFLKFIGEKAMNGKT